MPDETPLIKEDSEIQQSIVVSAEDIPEPNIQKWHLGNLAQVELKKEEKVRSDVIDQIRKEVAPRLIEQTSLIKKNAFEEARTKGYEDGFKQGVKAGRLEGKSQSAKEAEEALAPQVKSLQDLSEFMCIPYEEISEDVFQNLSNIVIEIAGRLVRHNIEQDDEWVISVIKDAVAKLPNDSDPIEIYLNPMDLALIERFAEKHKNSWNLVVDESLSIGCCCVKQNSSLLIDNWQAKLKDLLEGALSASQNILAEDKEKVALVDNPSATQNNTESESSDITT